MFPRKLASVDVGSNAIRFLVAEADGEGGLRPLESDRVPLRLGTDVFTRGELGAAALDQAVAALRGFRQRLDALGVARFRAVATSATRESANGELLVRRAWEEAGVRLEVLPGEEEARLVWRAVRARAGVDEGAWLLMDLGGGSVEVARVEGERCRWTESVACGSVKLLSEIPDGPGVADAVRGRLSGLVGSVRGRLEGEPPVAGLFATGGNMESILGLAGVEGGDGGARTLTLEALREVIARLEATDVERRQREMGLAPDRADVILHAAVVYATLAEAAGVDTLRVPQTNLKEGVLLDLADRLASAELSPTRLAFVSDVHGNVAALRAALEEADRRGAGRVIMAGDAVGDGPHPVEVIRMLRGERLEAIRGNVDRKALKLSHRKRKKLVKRVEERGAAEQNRAWTALQLKDSKEDRAWLEELPAQLDLEVGGHDVLVVHGSPRSDTDYILPSMTPEALARKLEPLGDRPRPAVLVSGHSHIPFVARVDGVLVVNDGSCGRPKDGDWRGSLAIVELEGEPRAEVVRFEYPMEAMLRDLEERAVPGVTLRSYHLGIK